MLSFATDICIRSGRDNVTEKDVGFAKDEVEVEFIRRSIERLSESQKILLHCVLTSDDSTPTGIYRLYNKRAEEKKIQMQHKRSDDIENFEKVKLALGEEEKKYAEKIRNFETELAELNAGLKRFGGMPLEKREEKLKRLEEKLKSLQGEV
ncbi:unnamed protein product [marine sediment metagenome]|uniref:Uncharacterized protein n=1 Tax=marine sediment metagenome TaxID=412755 RepID=X1MHJ1_9ZZZZ